VMTYLGGKGDLACSLLEGRVRGGGLLDFLWIENVF
jgi:hypothetical protein